MMVNAIGVELMQISALRATNKAKNTNKKKTAQHKNQCREMLLLYCIVQHNLQLSEHVNRKRRKKM